MRTPNHEQLSAIEHDGGILLRAGAGSGKTFVIIEHVVFLLKRFAEKRMRQDKKNDLKRELRSYLSGLVMMTFTNEAAGEMRLRLERRISELENAEIEGEFFWKEVKLNLGHLNISTIHGFCLKLIREGIFEGISPDLELVNELKIAEKITKLFDQWPGFHLETRIQDEVVRLFTLNRAQILDSLFSIFNSTEIRIFWEESECTSHVVEDAFWQSRLSEFYSFPQMIEKFDLSEYSQEREKSWYKFIQNINEISFENGTLALDAILAIADLVENGMRISSPRTEKLRWPKEFIESVRPLWNFVKQYGDDLIHYYKDNDQFQHWTSSFKNLFRHINEKYFSDQKISFSDLEYLVSKGMRNSDACQRISERYHYFIVDEFQDTSFVQFEIIKKCIDFNYQRLFCVGDKKQAIYGFRGGELGVFSEVEKDMPLSISLKNNYRSLKKVISFNNDFFSHLFGLGSKGKGVDLNFIEVEKQSVVEGQSEGSVSCLEVFVHSEEQIRSNSLNDIESKYLVEEIKDLLKHKESICVLYRSLGPSKFLVEKLIGEGISFVAQTKISYIEDPILYVLNLCCENILSERFVDGVWEGHFKFMLYGMMSYLQDQEWTEIPPTIFSDLRKNYKIFGLRKAFKHFIFSLNIANGLHGSNNSIVDNLFDASEDNPEKTIVLLKKIKSKKYSIQFRSGSNPLVKIMTTHASKGLEFDHVLLAGIHTNGRTPADSQIFGNLPGSFKWKSKRGQRKGYISPMLLLERGLRKVKEFSESKRLFYVACTRAKKRIFWVSLAGKKGGLSGGGDSWIEWLRQWPEIENYRHRNSTEIFLEGSKESAKIAAGRPLFHQDKLGIANIHGPDERCLATMGEVSVTRLSSLAACPYRFYLQNICRIELSDLDFFSSPENVARPAMLGALDQLSFDFERKVLPSSAERGTEIHGFIHEMISEKWSAIKISRVEKWREILEWVAQLVPYQTDSVASEDHVKFSLFGQMISGVSDLVIKGERIEVWDFKTGGSNSIKEIPYWFQLECYGLAYLQKWSEFNEVELVLCHLDEKKVTRKIFRRDELKEVLFSHWYKLSTLSDKNSLYCEYCEYSNICNGP